MLLFSRLIKSVFFRWNHKKKVFKENRINKLKQLHKAKIEKVSNKNFTIISQNCWGGSVYEDLNLPYLTPTIGLFFYAPCFIELLKDLKTNINKPLIFVDETKYDEANHYRNNNFSYPIAKLGDSIEIQFLHYKSEQEALEKWNRRVKRINWDNLFIACSDRDKMTPELMKEFDKLTITNKVIFTARKKKNILSSITLKDYNKDDYVGDLYNQKYNVSRSFNIANWLNK